MKLVRADDVKDLLKGLDSLPFDEKIDEVVDELPSIEETDVIDSVILMVEDMLNDLRWLRERVAQ